MKILVSNIQRFCLHDGQGIRTTVFLKGCSIHCPWCCNPENISRKPQYRYQKDNCIAKDNKCPYGKCEFADRKVKVEKLIKLKNEDMIRCKTNALGIYGKYYTCEELLDEILKDQQFWDENGGVTFSGGEPLLQIQELEPLLMELKERKINLCLETALFVDERKVKTAIKYFDMIFADIKIMDKMKCREILNGDIDLYLANLEILAKSKLKICLRHPMIEKYTVDSGNIKQIKMICDRFNNFLYEELPEHQLGVEKRKSLGLL